VIVAFDMFGTLADTTSTSVELQPSCGVRSSEVASLWRAKQLEYMFRVTAMGQFPTFEELTRWALVAALENLRIDRPDDDTLDHVVQAYRRLRSFADVRPCLEDLRGERIKTVVFSVGPRAWLHDLIGGNAHLVDDVVAAEEAGAYKPHPRIYQYLVTRSGVDAREVMVVSANPFDLIGAASAGLTTVWCRRDPGAVFDPWGARPDHVIGNLTELVGIAGQGSGPRPPQG
jgi:2-haloacid dehalogenase